MLSVRTVYILRLLHLVVLSPLLTKMVNRQFRRSTYCGYIRQEAAPAQRCVFGAGQSLRPSRRVASYSRLILVLRIELRRLEELAPCVCPTRCMHDLGSTHMIVCRVAVTLEYALEVAQEPFGTFPFPAYPKIEHHRCARPTVLPEIGLVIFAPHPFGLNSHRRLIGLDIVSGHQFLSHRHADWPPDPHYPTIQSRSERSPSRSLEPKSFGSARCCSSPADPAEGELGFCKFCRVLLR